MRLLFIQTHFGPPFQRDLIDGMARRGQEVSVYTAGLRDSSGKMFLRWNPERAVRTVDLVNSPLFPGTSSDPAMHIGVESIDTLTAEVLQTIKPDVVHAHELSGHGLSTLSVSQQHAPTVVSIHNHWAVCPQLNLLDAGGERCRDYQDGEKCTRCRWLPTASERAVVDRLKTSLAKTPLFGVVGAIRRRSRRYLYGLGKGVPGPIGWADPCFRAEDFVRRRAFGVDALNRVSAVHVMSNRSRELLLGFGVHASQVHVIPIATHMFDTLLPGPRRRRDGVVTFGYRGDLSYAKGVHILIDAFARVDQSKARLHIYGSGEPYFESALRRAARGLNIRFLGRHSPNALAKVNASIDVGIVPSFCDETFCMTAIEFLKCKVPIIATAVGGMLDYVKHLQNGLVVQPGDAVQLAAAMTDCLESPGLIDKLAEHDAPPFNMESVLQRFQTLYSEIAATAAYAAK
jgi:glycosyltransferase involved in cell wall biosynthesis